MKFVFSVLSMFWNYVYFKKKKIENLISPKQSFLEDSVLALNKLWKSPRQVHLTQAQWVAPFGSNRCSLINGNNSKFEIRIHERLEWDPQKWRAVQRIQVIIIDRSLFTVTQFHPYSHNATLPTSDCHASMHSDQDHLTVTQTLYSFLSANHSPPRQRTQNVLELQREYQKTATLASIRKASRVSVFPLKTELRELLL